MTRQKALSRSKVGAAQVRLKVGLVSDEAGHNFTFTSPQATALSERDKFEAELTNIIAQNRSGSSVPPPLAAAAPLQAKAIPPHVAATPRSVTPGGPASPSRALRQTTSRAQSVASDTHTSGTPVNDPTNDFRLRKKVLLNTPELAQLHRELVMGGHITEGEFWEGREVIICYVLQLFLFSNTRLSAASILFWLKPRQKVRNAESLASWLTHGRSLSMGKSRLL